MQYTKVQGHTNCYSPDLDVRKKALDIAMEMVSSKNVEEVVLLLKKELTKTVDQEYEKVLQHRIHNGRLKLSFLPSRTTNTDSSSFKRSILVPSNSRRSPLVLLACSWTSLVTLIIPLP